MMQSAAVTDHDADAVRDEVHPPPLPLHPRPHSEGGLPNRVHQSRRDQVRRSKSLLPLSVLSSSGMTGSRACECPVSESAGKGPSGLAHHDSAAPQRASTRNWDGHRAESPLQQRRIADPSTPPAPMGGGRGRSPPTGWPRGRRRQRLSRERILESATRHRSDICFFARCPTYLFGLTLSRRHLRLSLLLARPSCQRNARRTRDQLAGRSCLHASTRPVLAAATSSCSVSSRPAAGGGATCESTEAVETRARARRRWEQFGEN